MLLSQKEEGYKRNSGSKNVRRVLRFCFGALCGLLLTCIGPVAYSSPRPPSPAAPQGTSGHSISLAWTYTQGTDTASGFNVYRSLTSGGPYNKLTTTPLPVGTLVYSDTTGTGNTKYFYVVTAIDSLGVESINSNEAFATFISSSPNAPAGLTAVAK